MFTCPHCFPFRLATSYPSHPLLLNMDTIPDNIPDINFSFPPGLKESYIAAFLESIIYGAYIPVFFECIIVLRRKKLGNASHLYLLATTVSMFALVTARCIYEVHGCITTFDNLANLFESVQSSAFKIELSYALLVAIADAFIVFRTFIVWNQNSVVIALPAILYLAGCGMSIYTLVVLNSVGPEGNVLGQNVVNPGDIFVILTLCTNIVCTGLISFRILQSYRHAAPVLSGSSRRSESMRIVSLLIESAAINTLLLVGLLVSSRLNSTASYILNDCSSPTIGLVFSLIIVRVGRGTSYGEGTKNKSAGSSSTQSPINPSFELSSSRGMRFAARKEVEIGLDRELHRQRDEDDVNPVKYGEVSAA
ncbi:hypothetical protein C8J57DRAFT_1330400 [Mycena rebaudengoi]|nr:hypothetical protein C8J57DRAFT_1330400 [Mycena rebaudengoi]